MRQQRSFCTVLFVIERPAIKLRQPDRYPTIGQHCTAGYEGGLIGQKEQRRLRNLFRRRHAPEGMQAGNVVVRRRVIACHRGLRSAGQKAIDTDALRSVLTGQRLRQSNQSSFRCRIGTHSRQACVCVTHKG